MLSYWDWLDDNVKNIIYRFVHQIEFYPTISILKQLKYKQYLDLEVQIPVYKLMKPLPTQIVDVSFYQSYSYIEINKQMPRIAKKYNLEISFYPFPGHESTSCYLSLKKLDKQRILIIDIINLLVELEIKNQGFIVIFSGYEYYRRNNKRTILRFFDCDFYETSSSE